MLDDLELPHVQSITTRDVRSIAEKVAPGAAASLLQDLGRSASEVVVVGFAAGPGAADVTTRLDQMARTGLPVSFLADVTADSALDKVLIEDAAFGEVAGTQSRIRYELLLREHLEPVAPAATGPGPDAVDADALADALAQVEGLAGGLDIATDLVTGLERFLPELSSFLGRLRDMQTQLDAAKG
jgi:hypothetical protein